MDSITVTVGEGGKSLALALVVQIKSKMENVD
jgi:hypothetical protein